MRTATGDLDLVRVYLDEVGRHPLLTKEDEIELSQAYQAGLDAEGKLADTAQDDPARADLEAVADHGEWARRTMIESNLRLVVSIARRFSATGLPLGDLVQEGNLGLLRAVEKFDWRKGFKFSTYQALAAELHLPVQRVAQLKDTAQAITSLDAPVADDGAALGFSRERARRLERAALSALRRPETRARLEDLHVH